MKSYQYEDEVIVGTNIEILTQFTAGDFTPSSICVDISTYCLNVLIEYYKHIFILFRNGEGIFAYRSDDNNIEIISVDLSKHKKAINHNLDDFTFHHIEQIYKAGKNELRYPFRDLLNIGKKYFKIQNCIKGTKSVVVARIPWSDKSTTGLVVFAKTEDKKMSGEEKIFIRSVAEIMSNKFIGLCNRYFGLQKIESKSIGLFEPFAIGSKRIVALFADVRNFTPFTAKYGNKKEFREGMIRYYKEASQVIFNNNGMLDKFIGDGIMALFGVLKSDKRPFGPCVADACKAATEISRTFKTVNQKYFKKLSEGDTSIKGLAVGVGLECGVAQLGFYGYSKTQYYTALGMAVNTAARIENKAGKKERDHKDKYPNMLIGWKAYGALVGWQGYQGHRDDFIELELKGLEKPYKVFGLKL